MPYTLAPYVSDSMLRAETRRKNAVRVHVTQKIFRREVTMRFFQRLRNDDLIRQFCVIGWNGHTIDPNMFIESAVPGKPVQRWAKHSEGDLVVFTPPDGYDGGPVGWCYDRLNHWVEGLTEEQTKRFSFGNFGVRKDDSMLEVQRPGTSSGDSGSGTVTAAGSAIATC